VYRAVVINEHAKDEACMG